MARTRRAVAHDDRLSVVEHLDELRTRLIACVAVVLIAFSVCYWQNDNILSLVNAPLKATQNLSECVAGSRDPLEQNACFQLRTGEAFRAVERLAGVLAAEDLSPRGERAAEELARAARVAADATPTDRERQPVTLGVAEPFMTTITVALYASLLLAGPFLLYQAYAFVLPAFTPEERRTALPLMLMVPVLFLGGVTFAYLVALPRALDFLQNFNDDSFDILLQARDFYRFSILFMGLMGLLFQIPVGVLAVTRSGLISARKLQQSRGYVLLGVAVLAAVLTPTPDPITMLLAMGPLVVLFELSVAMARWFERREERRAAAEEDDEDPGPDEDDEPDGGAPPGGPAADPAAGDDALMRALGDEPAVS
jgi:sec-independent protein translocase protein TatC